MFIYFPLLLISKLVEGWSLERDPRLGRLWLCVSVYGTFKSCYRTHLADFRSTTHRDTHNTHTCTHSLTYLLLLHMLTSTYTCILSRWLNILCVWFAQPCIHRCTPVVMFISSVLPCVTSRGSWPVCLRVRICVYVCMYVCLCVVALPLVACWFVDIGHHSIIV